MHHSKVLVSAFVVVGNLKQNNKRLTANGKQSSNKTRLTRFHSFCDTKKVCGDDMKKKELSWFDRPMRNNTPTYSCLTYVK